MRWVSSFISLPRFYPVTTVFSVGAVIGIGVLAMQYGMKTALMALACVVVIVLLVLAIRFLFRWRERRRARSLYDTLDAEQQAGSSAEDDRALHADMRGRFADAFNELRQAGKGDYDLPWLLLIGEPQSGKSTTLRGSQLHFPVGTDRLSGSGGTRNCDWWFTNEAVILDTAGRFTFQDQGTADKGEWKGFLELLHKKRPHCPINGVLVVVPVDALLNDDDEAQQAKATNIHDKLAEIQRTLGVQYPVFVILTKCDLVLGFSEMFREFGNVQAAQMVGWSNQSPFDQVFDHERFTEEFDVIYRRLCDRRLKVMRNVNSLEERGLVYAFPEEFRSLCAPLHRYLKVMFAADIYHDPLFFRGYYFTSGMQEGMPIVKAGEDLLSGGLGGRDIERELDVLGKLFPSRPFFCADAYKAKALRETGLVFRSPSEIKRGRRRKVVSGIGLGVMLIGMIALATWGITDITAAVVAPTDHAERASEMLLSGPPSSPADVAQRDEDVLAHVATLDTDIQKLRTSHNWFRNLFIPAGNMNRAADLLQGIRDQVIVKGAMTGRVRELEASLTTPELWTEEEFENRENSMQEYLRWQAGAEDEDGNAAESFNRFFAALPNAGWKEQLREPFEQLGDQVALRGSALTPGMEWESSLSRKMLESVKDGFQNVFATKESEQLAHWFEAFRNCSYMDERLNGLLTLAQEFDNAASVSDFDTALAAWTEAYADSGDPAHPAFRAAKEAIDADKSYLDGLIGGREATAETHPWPMFETVQSHWDAALAPDGAMRKSFEKSPYEEEHGLDIDKWFDTARSDLNEMATTSIAAIDADYGKSCMQWTSLDSDYQRLAEVLAMLDAALTGGGDKSLDSANLRQSFAALTAEPEGSLKSARDKLQAPFQRPELLAITAGLGILIDKVDAAAQRNRRYLTIRRIEQRFSDAEISLEVLRDGYDGEVGVDSVGFSDVTEAYTSVFMLDTMDLVEEAQEQLAGWAGSRTVAPLTDAEGEPWQRLSSRLDELLKAYMGLYFDRWAGYYTRDTLPGFLELRKAPNWGDYHDVLKRDHRDFQAVAERRLASFVECVLQIDRHDAEQDATPVRKRLRRDHNAMLSAARADQSSIGDRFDVLQDALSAWFDLPQNKVAVDMRAGMVVSKVSSAFEVYWRSVLGIGKNGPETYGAERLATLDMSALQKLRDTLNNERIVNQLFDVAQAGRYRLDVELDNQLTKITGSLGGMTGAFPFTLHGGSADPRVVGKSDFQDFLQKMLAYEKRFSQKVAASDGAESGPRNYRQQYMDRCASWRNFLYGGAADSATLLGQGEPGLVFFQVQHERDDGDLNRIGIRHYTDGSLSIGREKNAQRRAGAVRPVNVVFGERVSPSAPVPLLWKFGDTDLDIQLNVSGAVAQEDLPQQQSVDDVALDHKGWALPLFIYRYLGSDDFARIDEGTGGKLSERTLWPVVMTFPLKKLDKTSTKKVSALFHIKITGCGSGACVLPPPIGGFDKTTQEPDYLVSLD